jgi:hypothetical protein
MMALASDLKLAGRAGMPILTTYRPKDFRNCRRRNLECAKWLGYDKGLAELNPVQVVGNISRKAQR